MRTGIATRSRRTERGVRWRRRSSRSRSARPRRADRRRVEPWAAVVVRHGADDADEQREAGDDRGEADKHRETCGEGRDSSVHRDSPRDRLASSHRQRGPGDAPTTAGARPRPIADRSPDRVIGAPVRAIGARDCGCEDGPQNRSHVDGTQLLSHLPRSARFSPSRSCSRLRARPWRVAMKVTRRRAPDLRARGTTARSARARTFRTRPRTRGAAASARRAAPGPGRCSACGWSARRVAPARASSAATSAA